MCSPHFRSRKLCFTKTSFYMSRLWNLFSTSAYLVISASWLSYSYSYPPLLLIEPWFSAGKVAISRDCTILLLPPRYMATLHFLGFPISDQENVGKGMHVHRNLHRSQASLPGSPPGRQIMTPHFNNFKIYIYLYLKHFNFSDINCTFTLSKYDNLSQNGNSIFPIGDWLEPILIDVFHSLKRRPEK